MNGWLSRIGRVLILILLIPLLPFLLLLIAILNWLGLNKSGAGPDYVIDYLDRFIAGTESAYDWDDFCSVPLKDPDLDAIRERACLFEPPSAFGEKERDALRGLLEEVKASQCAKR